MTAYVYVHVGCVNPSRDLYIVRALVESVCESVSWTLIGFRGLGGDSVFWCQRGLAAGMDIASAESPKDVNVGPPHIQNINFGH